MAHYRVKIAYGNAHLAEDNCVVKMQEQRYRIPAESEVEALISSLHEFQKVARPEFTVYQATVTIVEGTDGW